MFHNFPINCDARMRSIDMVHDKLSKLSQSKIKVKINNQKYNKTFSVKNVNFLK